MSWIIYKHTNKVNGKVYIGQTKQSPKLRWKNGAGYVRDGKNSVFAYAILKYKWHNFEHDIIERNISSQETANEREQYWIKYYNSYIGFKNSNGYNMTLGGDSGEHLGYPVYQIDKSTLNIVGEYPSTQEASRAVTGKDENSSAIRNCCEGRKLSISGFYWCYKSNYTPSWKPRSSKQFTPVYQIDDNLTVVRKFESIAKAVNEGFSGGTIVQCCLRKTSKANGYYWCYADDYSPNWKPAEFSFKRNEKIYCFETNKIYSNSKEASTKTGANRSKILRCCNKLENGTNGLHFCFAKDKDTYNLRPTIKRADIYSDDEIRILKEKYPEIGSDVSKLLPKRTVRSIQKMASHLGLKFVGENKHYKRVLCVELNKIFNSIDDAYKFVGLKEGSCIGRCCKGQRKTAGGYHWKYLDE